MKNFKKYYDEDAPVNATGTAVVGTGDDSSTVIVKKRKDVKVYRRKKSRIKEHSLIVRWLPLDERKIYTDIHDGKYDTDREQVVKKFKSFEDFESFTKKTGLQAWYKEGRNYRKEYDNYHAKPEQRERNAARLRARRLMVKDGKVTKFDKKDIHHKDNNPLNNEDGNLKVTTQKWNRTEPRLREEVEIDEWGDTSILSTQQARISGRPGLAKKDTSKPRQMTPNDKLKVFKKLKPGQEINLWFDSGIRKGSEWVSFIVGRRTVVGKQRVEKITLKTAEKGRMKYFLYNRAGQISFAMGDMGASLVAIKEEMITEAGRPRGAARIENERFWDLKDKELLYIIKDAGEAVQANPTSKKATQGPGNWSDQINDAATVLYWRKKKNIKIEHSINIDERVLSPKELSRREAIAKDLDDGDFQKRYGERWKEVKMAVATNMAKKEMSEAEMGDDPKADKAKAKELKIAKAIAAAQLAIAKEQERVQKLTDIQKKIKQSATEEQTMSKKYLETKEGSLEESVYSVWQRAMPQVEVPAILEKHYDEPEAEEEEVKPKKVDGRTKSYKETLRRIQLRKERLKKEAVEEGFSSSLVKKAVQIADQMGGDMTGAVKKIEKMKRGLSDEPAVKDALRTANEETVHEGTKEEYQKFFQAALKKFGAKSPAEMDDEKKKKFFDYIDKNWTKEEQQEFTEGELPPALKKAIAAKKKSKEGKKGDDEEDEDDDPVGEEKKNLEIDEASISISPGEKGDLSRVKKKGGGKSSVSIPAKSSSKEVDALRKIVKTKSMGKVAGSKVDLFSASAMVQVYDALNDKNRAKVDKMLKDKRGLMTFADFAMSQMKR